MRLESRIVVITGAASGIGRAVVAACIAEGATVVGVDRDQAELESLRRTFLSGLHRIYTADVADSARADAIAGEICRDIGVPYGLVTSAAVSFGGAAAETTLDCWNQVLAVNATGTFNWARALLPAMCRARRGVIVTVGSQLALAGGRGNAAYVASKGAVIALTRALALDYATAGIRTNCIIPGAIDTPLLARSFARQPDPDAARERSRLRHPMGRFGRPEEVAAAIVFLLGDEASFTTGAMLPVEGGWLVG